MIGLKKRPTYDELINHLDEDPIKHYPDRRATQMENSNYMSQLAAGFQEVATQNDRLLQEKTKSIALQALGQNTSISHREMQTLSHTNRSSNVSSYGSLSSLYQPVARPSFLPERDRGLLTSLFSDNYEEESRQRTDNLHNILDDEHQDFNDTVRLVTEPLIQRQDEMERHYEDQLALQSYENQQQRERHSQNLSFVRQEARQMLGDIYSQSMYRAIEPGSASSSSAAPMPMRMAIQDLTPIEPKTDSDEEELIPAEPIVKPGKLKPREEDVAHIYRPKAGRPRQVEAHGVKVYRGNAKEWQKESIKVLREQLRFRPELKLKSSEIDVITKDRAIFLLWDHDRPKTPNEYV